MASPYVALPKGVSEKTFSTAITEFRRALGSDSVLVSAEQLAPYAKTMMPVPDAEHTPSAALLATTVEQIQQVVAICNRFKVPIWTISTGKNLGYSPLGSRTQAGFALKVILGQKSRLYRLCSAGYR